jgi:SAM-dependent methyltransferase
MMDSLQEHLTLSKDRKAHWGMVYERNALHSVSWYREHLDTSLRMLAESGVPLDAAIMDVGGGHSTLVDDLLQQGYSNLTVLDLADAALFAARRRLGPSSARVTWIAGDVLWIPFEKGRLAVWHDRAVFHFLTHAEERAAYLRQMLHALQPGGHAILATFGPEGPTRCSGLDTCRYDATSLSETFGPDFVLRDSVIEIHKTPAGNQQQFLYCRLQRR